jgi:hypothetical protein
MCNRISAAEVHMEMTPRKMIRLLNAAKEDDERLEELRDSISDIADNEKK